MKPVLRIVTCRPLPEPDPDEPLLLAALERAGVEARLCPWRAGDEDWDRPLPTLVRSTWDYIQHVEEFERWIEQVERAAPLWNPGPLMRGNLHKRYLLDLAASGLPVVPTRLFHRGAAPDLAALLAETGWRRFVIKPAVGAGSWSTERHCVEELGRAQAHAAALAAERDLLVQPYLESVEGHGERALVVIDGELSHAVRKSPRFVGMAESVRPVPIEPAEAEFARDLLARLPPLLYGRVDLAPGPEGRPLLMELELVEPSLFLRQHPQALERLVAAVVRRLR